jgi:hypothetical protein
LTTGRIERNCDAFQKVCSPTIQYIETVKDTTIYRDTTVYIKLPGETKFDSIFIEVKKSIPYYVNAKNQVLTLHSKYAISQSWIKDNKLYAKLRDIDTTITIRLDNVIRENSNLKTVYEKQVQTLQAEKKSKWWSGFKFGIILTVIVCLIIKFFDKIKLLYDKMNLTRFTNFR